jgi:threonine aldolase
MLAAAAAAEVGDEQIRTDPTVLTLQGRMADLLGHEAALLMPTATMANQVALRALGRPGALLVAAERSHVLVSEHGGPAIHAGLITVGVAAPDGRVTPEQIWSTDGFGPGCVLVLENTFRSSAGGVVPVDAFAAAVDAAHAAGAAVHLDGARLFNAAIAASTVPAAWATLADSVTVCFSKGLGCPMGAVLAGSAEFVERAWEGKRLFGGALRQAGVVAAWMLHAIDHHVGRLADDHHRARRLAEGLIGSAVPVDLAAVETNMVPIDCRAFGIAGEEAIARVRAEGVVLGKLRPGFLRATTHLDVTDEDVRSAIPRIARAWAA